MSAIRRASLGVASLAASSSHPSHSHQNEKRPETGLWRGSSIVSLGTSDIGCEKSGLRNLSKVSHLWCECGLFEQLPYLVGATAALQMAHKICFRCNSWECGGGDLVIRLLAGPAVTRRRFLLQTTSAEVPPRCWAFCPHRASV